jgi:hypothetical protein
MLCAVPFFCCEEAAAIIVEIDYIILISDKRI